MVPVDYEKIMNLKKKALQRCQERIDEAATRPPCKKKVEDDTEGHGFTRSLRRKHGL